MLISAYAHIANLSESMMTVSKLVLQGDKDFAAPDVTGVHIDAMVLASHTAETYTVPTDARFLLFSASGNFYVRYDGSAAEVPSTEVADGTASELNPGVRYVDRVDSISIIAPSETVVTISAFK